MSSGDESLLDAGVRGLKDALVTGRAEVAAEHRAGATGQAVCAALRELTDRVITEAYRQALDGTRPGDRAEVGQRLALVAIGGYGRGDLAPHSDIDLLFLTAEKETPAVHTLVSRLLRDLWDIGLKVSHGVRSPTAWRRGGRWQRWASLCATAWRSGERNMTITTLPPCACSSRM
jgi:[protein-PII] uridylyltransferase